MSTDRNIFIIAADIPDGDAWATATGVPRGTYRVCTPQSPHRVRGFTASEICWTPKALRLEPAVRDYLRANAEPCLAGAAGPSVVMCTDLTPPRYEVLEQEPGMWSIRDHEHRAWALTRAGRLLPHHRKDRAAVDEAADLLNAGMW